MLISIAVLLLLIGLAYWQRVTLVNRILKQIDGPLEIAVEEVDLVPLGEIRVKGVNFLTPEGRRDPLLTIPEAQLRYDFDDLRQSGTLQDLVITGPEIKLSEQALASLLQSPPQPSSEAVTNSAVEAEEKPPLLDFLRRFDGDLIIQEGRISGSLPGFPEITGSWDLRVPADASARKTTQVDLTLSDLTLIGAGGARSNIDLMAAEADLSLDLSGVSISRLQLPTGSLTFSPSWLTLISSLTPASASDEAARGDQAGIDFSLPALDIEGWDLLMTGFDGEQGRAALPPASARLSLSASPLRYDAGGLTSEGPITLTLRDASWGAGDDILLSIDEISAFTPDLQTLLNELRLKRVEASGVAALLSDATLAEFQKDVQEPDPPTTEQEAEPVPASRSFVIENFRLTDGTYLMQDWAVGADNKKLPEASTKVEGELKDLRFGGGVGFASPAQQRIGFAQTRVRAPDTSPAVPSLFMAASSELTGVWDEWMNDQRLGSLTIEAPSIELTDRNLSPILELFTGNSDGDEKDEDTAPFPEISALDITGGQLKLDAPDTLMLAGTVKTGFAVRSEPSEQSPYPNHILTLTEVAVENTAVTYQFVGPPSPNTDDEEDAPELANAETVLAAGSLAVTVNREDLIKHRITAAEITDGKLRVGRGLKALVARAEAVEEEPKPDEPPVYGPPRPENSPWRINDVFITSSQVEFSGLLPEIEELGFQVQSHLTDLPLSGGALLDEDRLQKVELSEIEIRDPYDGFYTVARLPTVFVEFSLGGLAQQEIEKVDLLFPAVYIGQPLFWWTEYQRKFREQNEGASVGISESEDTDWIIKKIKATSGTLVYAPKGFPIGVAPFPFNAETDMKDGSISLKLEIPEEKQSYNFPDREITLEGLSGNVGFNVPLPEESNNVVQTFEVNKGRWKDFEATNLFLTVTFDEAGVYSEFGGDAYDGYVRGAANFYLKDEGKWDAWVSGTSLDTKPLTDAIAPETFLMEGKVSLNLVSEGRNKVLGETTGDFTTETKGYFDITKFDEILDRLPDDWTNIKKSVTELALVGLRRFDYDKGVGNLDLVGQDGLFALRFTGPYGLRELNLHLHDERPQPEPLPIPIAVPVATP